MILWTLTGFVAEKVSPGLIACTLDEFAHKRSCFWLCGPSDQLESRLVGKPVGFDRVAVDGRCYHVFPGCFATSLLWNDVVEI